MASTSRSAEGTASNLAFRRGADDDNEQCYRVMLESFADLVKRMGTAWDVNPEEAWARNEPLYRLLGDHAAEWWVAEDAASGELVGYARSVARDGLFELTELFVRPGRQSAGVGGRLLELAFPMDRGEVRAIIATPDLRALSRYYRAGTVARFPIVELAGAPLAGDDASGLEIIRASTDDIPALAALERAVLEFDRGPDELAWLLEQREGYLYRRDGQAVGLGFIGQFRTAPLATTGPIVRTGPIAALEPADQVPILLHIEARAKALGSSEVIFTVPMINEVAMRHLLGRRFQMDPFLTLLLSSRPFGQFDRYIGFSPQFVL
jgi:GNAT superfamily N-acetyltransferase